MRWCEVASLAVRVRVRTALPIVELAHHRGLRVPNKEAFDAALDRVIATSKDPVVVDRANRYKKDLTWVKPERPKVVRLP